MTTLFIIGTGRNGSKVSAHCLSANLKSKETDLHGEIHGGINPLWFKKCYKGKIDKGSIINTFKKSRDEEINKCKEIYIEKNHLLVPILNEINEIYPDAKFLYIPRNPKDIIRSYAARNPYKPEKMTGTYGEGRLTPRNDDPIMPEWKTWNNFEKSIWYVYEMTRMINEFLETIPKKQYKLLSYEQFTSKPSSFRKIYNWLKLDYDLKKIKDVLNAPIGSSCKDKAPHWLDWTDEQKNIYDRFFDPSYENNFNYKPFKPLIK